MRLLILVAVSCLVLSDATSTARAMPTAVSSPMQGVLVGQADTGFWAGTLSSDITHQSAPAYQARKVIDLSSVPMAAWRRVHAARISAFFIVRDYSSGLGRPTDGLDEAYEVVVNGHMHRYPTASATPSWTDGGQQPFSWHDHDVPVGELVRGPNEVVIRKAPGGGDDDYLYLGIDLHAQPGASSVQFDGPPWRTDALNIPGSRGEYMVRVTLIFEDLAATTVWHPGPKEAVTDPAGLLAYAGGPSETPFDGRNARIEWDDRLIDALEPLDLEVRCGGTAAITWINRQGAPIGPPVHGAAARFMPGGDHRPSGALVSATAAISQVSVRWTRSPRPIPPPVDMAPLISPPHGRPLRRPPTCRVASNRASLTNGLVDCRFNLYPAVRLTSLWNGFTGSQMLVAGASPGLFAITTGARTYLGSRDFRTESVSATHDGFIARLANTRLSLRADLTVGIDAEGLRLALKVINTGKSPRDLFLAFPHLGGLSASGPQWRTDSYFYPLGGGIIASQASLVRTTYGDHQALYQLMDLFSPARGGGLYLRVDDAHGLHKVLSLAKGPANREPQLQWDRIITQTREEYKPPALEWSAPGFALSVEYLRRTRLPGGSLDPPPVVLAPHAGDWHAAMSAYSRWAHRSWRFRPRPSRLGDVRQMIARGWSTDLLWKGGSYRTDLVEPPRSGVDRTMTDCVELMSWWDWSTRGPWNTPIDEIATRLSSAQAAACAPYIVEDPVTSQRMWNNQPGDYSGYNDRFGGLAAFRNAIRSHRKQGALVTLYTDPLRLDGNCPTGASHGREWTVVGQDGKPVGAYDVWNPCVDIPAVRDWVAGTVARVLKETGADGVRLDEYGHMGWACFSPDHKHTYGEPGVSQWNKATAEAVRGVRRAMDAVSPSLVLTTEHPAYDYLMQFLDGCITYDLSVQACPLRPLECNLQRFYFPECKPYELDYSGASISLEKKLWNAEGSFGQPYPASYYVLLRENRDALEAGTALPLIPTLVRGVYCNRFQCQAPLPAKRLYHLYNATGHTVRAPVLKHPVAPGRHLINLLTSRELVPSARGEIDLFMPRDTAACLADLPRYIRVTSTGEGITVALPPGVPGDLLSLCAADGTELGRVPAKRRVTFGAPAALYRSAPASVKLFQRGNLVDLVAVPGFAR